MKQIIRYRFLTIPGKIQGDIRITIDDITKTIYSSSFEDGKSTNIAIFPVMNIAIMRKYETDDMGNRVRSPWNPNDSIGLTKFNLPIFLNELKTIYEKMKMPNLYTYNGSRLELNSRLADDIRSVFTLGNTVVELSPVIIEEEPVSGDIKRQLEGIKMKFNNEHSSVLLTLNEIIVMIHTFSTLDVDNLVFALFSKYIEINKDIKTANVMSRPVVDIAPKSIDASLMKTPDINDDVPF